jgi:hypothetical protein
VAFVKGHGLADVTDRVEDHFRLFNEAIRSHDWTAFLATFTSDAAAGVDSSRPRHRPARGALTQPYWHPIHRLDKTTRQ